MVSKKKLGLKEWLTHIEGTELPMMSGVLQELNALTSNNDTRVDQLSEVILKDAVLTSQVLKIANSVFYNPGKVPLNTISRAVVVIGFTGLYTILISALMTDKLVNDHPKPALFDALGRAFHGAVQAKNLAYQVSDTEREEVFIAALLYNIGELALLSCDGKNVDTLCEALGKSTTDRPTTTKKVLGFELKQLSRTLVKQWELGELVQLSLSYSGTPDFKVRSVVLGDRVSQQMELGWDSEPLKKTVSVIARHLDTEPDDALEKLQQWSKEATEVARSFGINASTRTGSSSAESRPKANTKAQLQAILQLNILRDLSAMVFEGASFNSIFQILVEGIHRGIEMEQVAIAVFNPKNSRLNAKYMVGEGTEQWRENFDFPTPNPAANPLAFCIIKNRVIAVNVPDHEEPNMQENPSFQRIFEDNPVMLGPLYVGKKPIGVICATRVEKVTEEEYQSFQHFVNQANLCLAFLMYRQ
ncbi:MAG: HDOD domain-containing protein [Pseudomonadales bacterium]|nr:HDOD domain-containing protein [Pseudomonadales bacterium]